MEDNTSKINFNPWVGKNYEQGINGKKVLVLGESHYCAPVESRRCTGHICNQENAKKCSDFTIETMNEFVYSYWGGKYQQTFLTFERQVTNKELSQEEREEFWNSLMFYNYLQYALEGPRQEPSPTQWKMWAQSEEAFEELLQKYLPDKIIVWGKRLFEALPEWDSSLETLVTEDGQQAPVRDYHFQGKAISALQVYHPAMPNGKARGWHEFYKLFLK